jgi:flagellar protein FliT
MTADEVLDRYERLRGLSAAMLASARGGEWDNLISLEQQCSGVLQPLISADGGPPLSAAQHKRKVAALRSILNDDAEIRALTTSWMNKLQQLIGQSARDKAARRFYGDNA